ncbi:RDD family protein [Streptomyces fuscigenes]|uniref:RDD family protein n=1 Tax=Streptomyces fuscigenes TaxID=1528880 RepID=UPI001F28E039|nr:RDD family protein [Streptomyces fuscigenes]MCF3960868.1 RDD family protein [Streptomyces fuscigenes]
MSELPDPTRLVGRRCAQFVLDRALLTAVGAALSVVAAGGLILLVRAGVFPGGPGIGRWLAGALLVPFMGVPLIGGFFNEVWLLRRRGSTIAMRMLRLCVVDRYGTRPTWSACLLRWLAWVVDGALFGLVGLVLMLCTRHHQRLGDLVARTYVVRAGAGGGQPEGSPG